MDGSGSITVSSNSVIESTSGCSTTGSPTTGAPGLGSLTDSGGDTDTHLPGGGSNAIDNGTCSESVDQRGFARPEPSGTLCDIGGVEVGSSAPGPDLQVTKTESIDPVVAGSGAGNLTYVVTVENIGTATATGVALSEVLTLLSGVTLDSATPSQGSFSSPTWTVGTLAASASATLTVVLTAGASAASGTDVISNTATVTAINETETDTSNNSATESTSVSREVDLDVTKTESIDPVVAGSGAGNLTYVVTVTNNGPSDASGVALSEILTLPAGVTLDSVTPSAGSFADPTWTVGGLASGASATLTVVLTVDGTTAPGVDVIANTAAVTAVNETDTDASNDSAMEATSVSMEADLRLSKSASTTTPDFGGTVVFTIEVTNDGPTDLVDVEVSDLLPSGLVYLSDDGGGAYDAATGLWSVGVLAAGATATLAVTARVETLSALENTACAASLVPDPDESNNCASVDLDPVAADLSITKTLTGVTGDAETVTATFKLTVTNHGPSHATGVAVSDPLPEGATLVASSGAYDEVTGIWTIGALASGSSATLGLELESEAGSDLVNIATVSGDQPDQDLSNNLAGAQAQHGTDAGKFAADLSVSKTVDNATPSVSDTLVYTVTVTNGGPSTTAGVSVLDQIVPDSLVAFVSAEPSSSYDAASGLWAVGHLPVGSTAQLTVRVRVVGAGTITNTAEVLTSTLPDPDASDDQAAVRVEASLAQADTQAKATAVEDETGVPEAFVLYGNYPNPFNPETTIPYAVPEASHVRIAVYDVLGREVAVLVDAPVSAGRYEVRWEAGIQPSGVYLVRLVAGGVVRMRHVTLMK